MPRGTFVCPECGRPVRDAVVGRRKVLGAFVPVWGAGPCENPECRAYGRHTHEEEGAGPRERQREHHGARGHGHAPPAA
ncbi:hypothetical protein GCM10027168_18060 [Streptomyces capparidis]